MRTTVTIDDEAYQLASLYANAKNITLGAALSELVKKANNARDRNFSHIETGPNGLPVFRSRGRTLTSEMVKAAQEDEV